VKRERSERGTGGVRVIDPSALQGLNSRLFSALAGPALGVMSCRRFRFAPPTVIHISRLRR